VISSRASCADCSRGSRSGKGRPSTAARAVISALLAVACATGCTRTVLVSEGSPVRIGPCARARVYSLEGAQWRLGDNRVELPEGWYLVPPSFVESEE